MWNQITGSSNEDETLGSCFFTNGLFKITNEEKSIKDPFVLSILQNNSLFVGVDKSLILLEDYGQIDCRFVSFGAEINCFAVSPNANYIICCLTDGSINGVHIKGVPLFNMMINEEDISLDRTFIDIQMDVYGKFNILCSNGATYKLTNVDDDNIQVNDCVDTNSDATCVMNQTALLTPFLDRASLKKFSTSKINCFTTFISFEGSCTLICYSDYAMLLEGNRTTQLKYPKGSMGIKKIINFECFLIGLTMDGKLIEICTLTGIMRNVELPKDLFIDEIRTIESNQDFIELMMLSKPTTGDREMHIVDFPSLKSKSVLNLPATSWIIQPSKSAVNMYFIEGYKNEENYVQTIEIKSITDTDPEQRFNKFLLRGQFDEAESFANTIGLSLEPLHRMKVKRTITELSCVRTSDEMEKKFHVLLQQLPLIEDKKFLVSLKSSKIPDRTCLTKFLEYILKNINTNDFQEETNEINELLLRLETLRLVDPDDTNMRWQRFLEERDMQKAACEYFKIDVSLACLVWSRHASSIIPNLNLQKFYVWLAQIPSTIEPFQLIQWFKHFAPSFLQSFPDETTRFTDWTLERTRSLQFSTAWPEIGLEFINNIHSVFEDMKFMFVDIRRSHHANMEKIQKLIHILEEMVVLKKSYHLIISLDDYCSHSIEDTAFKLLQRIQIHNLGKLVNDFLYPIFMENGLLPEETIVRYINFLTNNKNLGYWQDRAVICVDLLNNEENRLNCALLILKVSPVPWSDVVISLAKLGTTSSHPIAKSILIEYDSQAVKMIKIKYGWSVDYFDFQPDRIQLVFRILKLNLPEMIEDVKTLIESSKDIACDAYVYLIYRLVELGKIEEFYALLQNISSNQEKIIMHSISLFIDELDSEMIDKEIILNFMEAMKLLLSQLKNSTDEYKYQQCESKVNGIMSVIEMRKCLDINIKLGDFLCNQNDRLADCIDIIINEIQSEKSVDKIWMKIDLLSRAFRRNQVEIFLLICRKLENIYVTCHFVEYLCESGDVIRDSMQAAFTLELIVLMISQQINQLENNFYNFNALLYDPLTFPLAYELLKKSLQKNQSIMEFINCIGLICQFYPSGIIEQTSSERKIDGKIFSQSKTSHNGVSNGNKRDSLSMFDRVEENNVAIITTAKQIQSDENLKPIVQCVCSALKLVVFVINSCNQPFKLFIKYLDMDDEQLIKNNFFSALESVLKYKLSMSAFGIIQFILSQQDLNKVLVLPPVFVSTITKKTLKFMLSQKKPEYLNAFILLRAEKNQLECLNYLKQALKNNSQRVAFSTFSEMYNTFKNSDECIVDRESRLKLFYYLELCKQYPNLQSSTNLDTIQISEFLKDLEKRQLSLDLVKKLCTDFGRNYQKMLVRQIKIVLSQQKLDFEIKTDQLGKDEVIVKINSESIKKMCMVYLNEITDHKLLFNELEKFFVDEVNFYFYELYLVVIDLIEYTNELPSHYFFYRSVLLILKHNLTMKRRSIETEEYEEWMKFNHNSNVEGSVLPIIANYRLPFKLLIKSRPENIIGKDLNVEAFEVYYQLLKIHAEHTSPNICERIDLCTVLAAKNSVQDLQIQAESTASLAWNLTPRNNAFLQAALRMVSYVSNKGKILATLYFILTNTPRGGDQMEAAYESWKFAMAHEDEIRAQPKYHDLVDKVIKKYFMLKSQHLLYLYGVYDDKLIALIENPGMLIQTLYHHESILTGQKKEINKLCSELADLHNVDLLSLQTKLLRIWLSFSDEMTPINNGEDNGEFNETVYEDFMGSAATSSGFNSNVETKISDENVSRAYYVLSSWENESSLDFLAGEINSQFSDAENQIQLYECFAKIISDDNSNYLDIVRPETYLVIRVCYYLKKMGLNFKPEVFRDFDKVELLKKIWSAHYNNPKGLEIMALICITYNVHLPQIWNGILKQMIAHKMIKHLSILVEILSIKTRLLHLSNLKSAWEFVIQEPFIYATKVKSYDQDHQLSKSFILLQKCPISTFLNLVGFAEKCMLLDRPYMAAIFIAYAKENDREKIITMLGSYDKQELKKNIEDLEEFGIAPVITKSVMNILEL